MKNTLRAEELLQDETFEELLSIDNDIEQVKETNRLRDIAKDLGMLKNFDDVLKMKKKKSKARKRLLKFPKTNDEGIPKNLQTNVWALMEYYNIDARYNELKKEIDIAMTDSDQITQDNKNEILEECIYDKCIEHDFSGLSKDRLSSMLLTFADINKFNPVKDYLESLNPIEGTYHLDMLCETLVTPDFDKDFKKLLLKTWLISCVAAAYSPNGLSAHGVLVLQGGPGVGKTSWFKSIVPNPEWFKDGKNIDVKNKDTIVSVVKYWITELGEIGSTLKKDFDALKAFLTQNRDELRRAFARKESSYPRRTIFCGSVNQDQFLTDETGNRRFWTIPVFDVIYKHDVPLDGLWSEIVFMFQAGEPHFLSLEDQAKLAVTNSKHDVLDYTDTLIECGFQWDTKKRYRLTSADVFRELGAPIGITLTRISRSLTKKGLKQLPPSNGKRYWEIPMTKLSEINWRYAEIQN